MTLDPRDEALRARFEAPPPDATAAEPCPEADRIWLAARGRLPWPETEALLDHAASCPACTIAWRMAREQLRSEGGAVARRSGEGARWLRYVGAAAILVIGAILAVQGPWRRPEAPSYRATAPGAIRSALSDDAALPRSDFRLRWTPGPDGARYSIVATDARLAPVAEVFALERPELLVPETALAGVKDGERVLWQVKATFPDGTRVTSETFATRVGPAAR